MNASKIRFLLECIELFTGLTALLGGFGLISSNGLGSPTAWLNGYFSSYTVPGLFLSLVGIVNFFAFWGLQKDYKYKYEVCVSAGFGILLFEFFELYIMLHSHPLQIFYFGLGVLALVFIMLLLKREHHKADSSNAAHK
jgi:hypothetical protein